MNTKSSLLIMCGLLLAFLLYGQPEVINEIPSANPGATGTNIPPFSETATPTRTTQEYWISIGVLLFGIVVVGGQIFLFQRRSEPLAESMKYLTISLIVVGSLFLVTAGYGNEQIAPIIGLLGTIAGYLLGRQREGGK